MTGKISSNTNVNDALGDYSLTLVDSLDTLVIMGNTSEFRRAAQLVVDHVTFDRCTTVQVFEATIRVMGSLLSAYLLTQPHSHSSPLSLSPLLPPDDPTSERLLEMAHDLAIRLLPAFENTTTGIPHPRVNLCTGVAVTGHLRLVRLVQHRLSVEFTLLSRLRPHHTRTGSPSCEGSLDNETPATGWLGM
ncbi:ER degradation-enhancing alpha-mannosidase-like protein 1 [Geodia barretti]|uniref:alpha-1,2-Mannosidase n=1 Tax=Geodia barretti TaxID=519541 RepID=A0AA35QWJ2_GEOBA|nr:ER degradation-enhancing alpha-mannosidase-like protein 1 [Geodia barretti]